MMGIAASLAGARALCGAVAAGGLDLCAIGRCPTCLSRVPSVGRLAAEWGAVAPRIAQEGW